MLRIFVPALLSVAVAACGSEKAPETSAPEPLAPVVPANAVPDTAMEWIYSCTNGQRLIVGFDHPRKMATARGPDGLAVDLMRKETAEGYLYQTASHILKGNGHQAQWSVSGQPTANCRLTQVTPLP